jgi:hypothetical protein
MISIRKTAPDLRRLVDADTKTPQRSSCSFRYPRARRAKPLGDPIHFELSCVRAPPGIFTRCTCAVFAKRVVISIERSTGCQLANAVRTKFHVRSRAVGELHRDGRDAVGDQRGRFLDVCGERRHRLSARSAIATIRQVSEAVRIGSSPSGCPKIALWARNHARATRAASLPAVATDEASGP